MRHGRLNACPNFRLIGVHVEGALAEYVTIAAEQAFPVTESAGQTEHLPT